MWPPCSDQNTHLALRPSRLHLFHLFTLLLLLDHAKERVTSPLELLRTPALEEPVEPEHRELRDILLDTLVHVLGLHAVVVEAA